MSMPLQPVSVYTPSAADPGALRYGVMVARVGSGRVKLPLALRAAEAIDGLLGDLADVPTASASMVVAPPL